MKGGGGHLFRTYRKNNDTGASGPDWQEQRIEKLYLPSRVFIRAGHGLIQMHYYKIGNGIGLPKSPILGHHAELEMTKG